ncbi:DNA translocase FtsK [Bacillus sp. REN16]|uniref:DNA translocase FtsK n=1 Tax=Bacillus sp. REN16 TaxID=2887296 RepID=UPI001E3ECAC8|nr:DNA translocase FtsK [Bacillus sp. REN16]MCC3357991.1 DNA translocase FtsK [Bacillus sp. REN16]
MNWIKKLLHFLQTDEDDPIEIKTTQIRQQKHIEARVTYEYPKGNFRFPVIPDQDKEIRKKENIKTGRTRQTRSTQETRITQPTRTSQPKKSSNPKPVVKLQEKQPFRPTETPSPVYGLSKPKPHEIIEFELPATPITDTESIARAWKEAHEEVAPAILLNEEVELKLQGISDEESQEKVASFVNQLIWEEESPKEEPVITEPFSLDSTTEEMPIQVIRIEEPVVSIEPEPNLIEQDTKQPENVIAESLQQSTDEIDNVEVNVDSVAEINEDSVKNLAPQVEQTQKPEETRPKPRRSNIPFNVLMFKKDKQKLSQKDTKQLSQPASTIPVKSEEKQEQMLPQETTKQQEQPKKQELELLIDEEKLLPGYTFPGLSFLNAPPDEQLDDSQWLIEQRHILDQTLRNFKVRAKVVNVTQGPAVTRFEVHPEPGVKVNKITNLSDDIKLSLAAKDIRIEAPIPGKNTIGIEVPNKQSKPVLLKEIIKSSEFISNKSPLTVAMGLDISGKPIVTDLQKMPHGLIAGATGSGKSVCINAMLVSLLYKASPDEVKLLLIDPKMVELAPYNHIPHLVSPVITDVKAATAALKWAVEEMERRYELFAHTGVRDIGRYNEMVKKHDEKSGKLPYLVIIIDELADLMMVAPGDVEDSICRIAQKARACGIHLILATQRPSVDVITGLIKANIPTRIAFSVSSQVDSRTIIDSSGAEKLLGKGDMLFLENGSSKPFRVQGNFVSDDEIEAVVDFVKDEMKPSYMFEQEELLKKSSISNDEDELFLEACEFVLGHGGASTSSVQRRFRIGYNRAARLIDMMEEQGIISESRGSKPREVLITEEDLADLHEG